MTNLTVSSGPNTNGTYIFIYLAVVAPSTLKTVFKKATSSSQRNMARLSKNSTLSQARNHHEKHA